jgi:hypothetical protein
MGILAIGNNKRLYTRADLDSEWVIAPDKGEDQIGICVMHDGSILGIGTDQKLHTRADLDSEWVPASNKHGLVPFSAPLEMGWIFMVSWKKRWSGYHVNRNY